MLHLQLTTTGVRSFAGLEVHINHQILNLKILTSSIALRNYEILDSSKYMKKNTNLKSFTQESYCIWTEV